MEMVQLSEWLEKGTAPGLLGNLILLALFVLLLMTVYYLIHIGNRFVPEKRQLHLGLEQTKLLFFVLLGGWILVWLFLNATLLLSVVTPFILAGIFAYALNPVVLFFTRHRLTRTQSVAGLFLLIIVLLVVLSMSIFPRLGDEARHLGEQLPHYSRQWYNTLSTWYQARLASYSFLPDSLSQITDYFGLEMSSVTDWLMESVQKMVVGISALVSSLVTLITVPVLTFYFLKDADSIAAFVQKMVPPISRPWVYPLARQIDEVLGGFIRGQLIVATIVGILSGAALLLLGIDFAVILGILAGITNIIPYLGPFIGAIPAVFIALLTSPLRTLWVIIAFVVIQQVESSLISPKIVGERVGLHPTLVILSLLVGGALWGLVGLIIAVPLAGVIRVLLKATVDWFKLRYPSLFDAEL